MKATGIVRRIDDLGRVVIPKEIRRTLRIREGDPLEIFTDREGEIILKKYSPIGELSDFAQQYSDALYQSTKHTVLVTDGDTVIAVSGGVKKDYLDKPISPELEKVLEIKKTVTLGKGGEGNPIPLYDGEPEKTTGSQVITPIISRGDCIGAVIITSKDDNVQLNETDVKLAETAASFLGKQMED